MKREESVRYCTYRLLEVGGNRRASRSDPRPSTGRNPARHSTRHRKRRRRRALAMRRTSSSPTRQTPHRRCAGGYIRTERNPGSEIRRYAASGAGPAAAPWLRVLPPRHPPRQHPPSLHPTLIFLVVVPPLSRKSAAATSAQPESRSRRRRRRPMRCGRAETEIFPPSEDAASSPPDAKGRGIS